jgi:hypothetical protein
MDDKIIVTSRSALIAEYGSKGLTAVNKALAAMKVVDKKHGNSSRFVTWTMLLR